MGQHFFRTPVSFIVALILIAAVLLNHPHRNGPVERQCAVASSYVDSADFFSCVDSAASCEAQALNQKTRTVEDEIKDSPGGNGSPGAHQDEKLRELYERHRQEELLERQLRWEKLLKVHRLKVDSKPWTTKELVSKSKEPIRTDGSWPWCFSLVPLATEGEYYRYTRGHLYKLLTKYTSNGMGSYVRTNEKCIWKRNRREILQVIPEEFGRIPCEFKFHQGHVGDRIRDEISFHQKAHMHTGFWRVPTLNKGPRTKTVEISDCEEESPLYQKVVTSDGAYYQKFEVDNDGALIST